MHSVLGQLGNEAVLVMYLADELSAEDRAEVEQLLATDRNLQLELQRVRLAQEQWLAAVGSADRVPVAEAVTVRRASRTIRQWQAQRLARATPAPAPMSRWWAYPAAAAAILLIALAWWGFSPSTPGPQVIGSQDARSTIADSWRQSEYPTDAYARDRVSFGRGMVDDFTRHGELRRVERELVVWRDQPVDEEWLDAP